MRPNRLASYVIYVIAFACVCSLASELQMILNAWSWGFSAKSLYSISELLRHFPKYMFHGSLQVVIAVLMIRTFSLRHLFYLSCIFSAISVLLTGLDRQMTIGPALFFPLSLIGQVLPYAAPLIVLAFIARKKGMIEPVLDADKGIVQTIAQSVSTEENRAEWKVQVLYRRYWYVFDVLLITIVFLYATLNDPFGLIMYVCGLYNQMLIRSFMMFIWVLWLVPASFCLVVLLLRMSISWPKYIASKRKLLMLRIFFIIGFGFYSILPFAPVRPVGINIYVKGFKRYIEARADITGIRNWLGTLSPDDCVEYNIINPREGTKKSSPKWLQKSEWPDVVNPLKPRFVILSLDDGNRPKVRFNWGSGLLGSWGFTVGNKAMPTPKSDLSSHGEYRKEISKGVYIWYGLD